MQRPLILVVDDEPRGVELVCRTLRGLGEVRTAASGAEGWEIAQRTVVDLVVADQRMPGMTGVELLTRMAERDERTGRILLTGYADHDATVQAINRAQIHAYLAKPCPPDQLLLVARSVLERGQCARENARLVGDLRNKNVALEGAMQDLRAAQERLVEAERLSAIGRMISIIVNDFRGPLSVIRSLASEVAREGVALGDADLKEVGRTLGEEGEHMTRMCTKLLEVTRASQQASARVPHDLDAVVRGVFGPLVLELAPLAIELELDLAADVEFPLDEDRVRRALTSLAHNAVEAMPEGGLLRVRSRREGDEAGVEVGDTGCGVPEAVRERLFEAFVTAGKPRGCGLGLAIVRKVMEDHGGRVTLAKAEGLSTCFRLHFPLGPAPRS